MFTTRSLLMTGRGPAKEPGSELTIFNAALGLPPEERAAWLARACGDDAALRERTEALLSAHAASGSLEHPAVSPALGISPLPNERAGDRIGPYKLLQQIGEGGCGVVYIAEQDEPVRRRVALKAIKLGMDTKQVIARFEAERQALAMMDHPNIAKVLDAGATENGRPYFVMELVRGVKITEFCDHNNLPTRERLELFLQVCRAVQHAHQKGIIHRDIKPSNILVTISDRVPLPKVIDFGIAKATQGRLTDKTLFTAFEQFIGTPAYMSPEQSVMTSLDIDTRSDIYSLGVLLYELLTGKTPFDSKELLEAGLDAMRRTIQEKEPERPSTKLSTMVEGELTSTARRRQTEPPKLISSVRGDLDWIVMKCLEKDRARRYETANGLARDLQRHLNHEPVAARPPSTAYRLQKAIRRHKLAFAAGAAVVAALLVGASVSTWKAIEASRAQHEAENARVAERQQRFAAQQERDSASAAQRFAENERQRADQERLTAQRQVYTADLALAQMAWEQNQVGRLRQLLEQTAESAERGFEWYYWQSQAHLELKTLRGHNDGLHGAAISPDGQRMVTGSDDWTAKVWDTASGKELLTLRGHSAGVNSVAFAPDGRRIVTGSDDGTARVWDAAAGRELLSMMGHTSPILGVAFSPDGQRIATSSRDQTARIWEASSGQELLTLKGHSGRICSVSFSPDGQRVVTGSQDRTAKVWEASSGKELLTLKCNSDGVNCAAFSPDGQHIVTGGDDQTAGLWEATTGKELLRLRGHSGGVACVAFSTDGQRIVTGSRDQTAKVWETASGKDLFTLKGHGDSIASVAFSPDGQRIVTASADRTAKVWESSGDKELHSLGENDMDIRCTAFSPDGQRIVTAIGDKKVKVWEAAGAEELMTLTGHTASMNSSDISGCFQVLNGAWIGTHVASISSGDFSPDGKRIVTGSQDGTARVWGTASGNQLLTLKGYASAIWSAAFSPDGQRIATGSADHTATVWESATGKELLTVRGHVGGVGSLAFSPDGQRLVTASDDRTANVWDAASGKELLALRGHNHSLSSVAFSPDGQRIVTGSQDRTAKVWDAASGKELLALKGHNHSLSSVAFSPDGQRIVTGSDDGTAIVWEAATGQELLTLKGHSDRVNSVVFSADGRLMVTSSRDNTARMWETASVEQVANRHRQEQAAEQDLAEHERERVAASEWDRVQSGHDPGAIKQWLVVLPFPFDGRDGSRALQDEQVAQESQLRPHVGQRMRIGGDELAWQAVQLEDYKMDFRRLAGRERTEWCVAYAVAYIQSEASQNGVLLKVGSDDQSKVYLNGRLVYQCMEPRGYRVDQDVVAGLELKAGLNVLVFKVVNELMGWQGSVRLTDCDGKPLPGIKVALDQSVAKSR